MGLVIHFLVFNSELGPFHTWMILYLDYLQKTGLFIFNPSIRFFPTKHSCQGLTYTSLTWAGDSYILLVSTVMLSPPLMFAVPESWFIASTRHMIHPNAPGACTGIGPSCGFDDSRTSQLLTNHGDGSQVPAVVTHSSPLFLDFHLHSPRTLGCTGCQPQLLVCSPWNNR